MQALPLRNPSHATHHRSRKADARGSAAGNDGGGDTPVRCLTIDVEEHFHIEAAHGHIPRWAWDTLPRRAEYNVHRLLDLFDRTAARATFFFLGDVARRHPTLARRCADAGHEIASHGDRHDRLHRLTPATFRSDLLASKHLLEDQIGAAVHGYRAPTWSITRETAWAVDVLAEVGFTWDASIFPVRHPWYGIIDAPTTPFFVRSTCNGPSLLELPPLTWRGLGRNHAAAGGGYFRLLPFASTLMRTAIRQAAMQNRPAIVYFHPWEFDADAPHLPLPPLRRLRTYTGVATTEPRLERILNDTAPWRSIADCLHTLRASAITNPNASAFTLLPAGSAAGATIHRAAA